MNYRHAYHAGNHADCLKHALLVWLLGALRRKPAPFTVLDTHAGIGAYDLAAPEAQATGEWRHGIGVLRGNPAPALSDYLALVGPAAWPRPCAAHDPCSAHYPGSPVLARSLLRPGDRLICCERHPADAAVLRRRFARDPQVAVHGRDGFAALGALLPPPTARGLVLIDPPYEQADEADRVIKGLVQAQARFRAGVLAAWFPIKHLAPVRAMRRAAQAGLRDAVAAMLWLRPPLDAARLNGSGLLVVNPPFGFEQAAREMLAALAAALGEDGAGTSVERWAVERWAVERWAVERWADE